MAALAGQPAMTAPVVRPATFSRAPPSPVASMRPAASAISASAFAAPGPALPAAPQAPTLAPVPPAVSAAGASASVSSASSAPAHGGASGSGTGLPTLDPAIFEKKYYEEAFNTPVSCDLPPDKGSSAMALGALRKLAGVEDGNSHVGVDALAALAAAEVAAAPHLGSAGDTEQPKPQVYRKLVSPFVSTTQVRGGEPILRYLRMSWRANHWCETRISVYACTDV